MKIFRLILIVFFFLSASLFCQDYPEITFEELQGVNYTIVEEFEEYFYVDVDGIIYICYT